MPKKQLISKNEIDSMVPVRKQHFLNEKAVRMTRTLGDGAGLSNIGVHIVELEPGAESTEYHFHHNEEEFVYILEGSGQARIGKDTFDIGSGDFIGFPAHGEAHSMKNTGDVPLKYLMAGQRLGYDVCDYPEKKKRLYRHENEWNVADIDSLEDPR